MRLTLLAAAALSLAACGGNASNDQAAADSAGVPNTQNGALSTVGPVGDTLSSAAAGATVSPGATDTTRDTTARDTTGRSTRPPR